MATSDSETDNTGFLDSSLSVRENIVWYTVPRLLSRASAFLLLPIYTKVLSPGEFGLAMVSLAAGGLLSLVVAPGVERAYLYWVFQKGGAHFPQRLNIGTVSVLHISLLACSITMLAIWADAISQLILPGIATWPFYYVVLIVAALTSLAAPLRARWRSQHRADKVAALELSYAAISISTILIGLLVVKAGAISILLGDLFAHIVLLPFYIRRLVPGLLSGWDWKVCRAVMPVALVGFPLSLSTWAFSGLDRIFLNWFAGAEEVGIYGAGYQIGAAILILGFICNKEWQPLIFSLATKHAQLPATLQELWTQSLRLFLVGGSLVAFFSDDIVHRMLGQQYLASATIIPFIVTIAVLNVPHFFLVNFGLVCGKTYALMIESFLSVGVFVIASIILIPHFGALGVASAGVLARTIGCLFLYSKEWNLFLVDQSLVYWMIFFLGAILLGFSMGEGIPSGLIAITITGLVIYQATLYWKFLETIRLTEGGS